LDNFVPVGSCGCQSKRILLHHTSNVSFLRLAGLDSFYFPVIFPTPLFALVWTKLTKLTPWHRVLLEKLTCSQLLEKFHGFFCIYKIITAFTWAWYLSIFWLPPKQSMGPLPPPPNPTSWRSILILTLYICHATILYWQRINTNLLPSSIYLLVTSPTYFNLT
jgi:hypothetical protein